MSTIAAGTTSGTALVSTGNTDGTIQLQVNGTTPSVTLDANGAIGVGSTPGYGTSGQVLTSGGSGAAPTWAAAGGGISTANTQSITTNLSLTSASAGLQVITSDQDGRSVILPNATTLTVGAPKFIVNNVGNFQLGVRNYDGTLLASIDAGGTAILSLSSIATSAGAWDVDGTALLAGLCVGEVQLGTTGQTIETTAYGTAFAFTKLSETLAVYFYRNSTTAQSYLRTFDYSTSTFGTELNITGAPFGQSDNSFFGMFRVSDTGFLAGNYDAGAGIQQIIACTVSAGVITAGSSVSVSGILGNVGVNANSIVQLSDSLFFIGTPDGIGNFVAKAFTVSGTTITAGSLATSTGYLGTDFTQYYKLSSTSILISGITSGTAQYYLAATVSGTTITFGTQTASTTIQVRNNATTIAAYSVPICVIDDNKFIVGYTNAANSNRPFVLCATVSGTTITFGTGVEIAQINFSSTTSSSFYDGGGSIGYQGYQPIQKISTTAFFINFNSASLQSVISCGTVSGSTITIAPYSLQTIFCASTNTTSADGFGGWIPSNANKLPNVEIGTYAQLYLQQQFTATNVFNVSLRSVYVSNNQPYLGKNISYVNNPAISNTNLAITGVGPLTQISISSWRFGPYIILKIGTVGQRIGSTLVYKCVGNSIVFLGEIKNTYATNNYTTPITNTKFVSFEYSAGFYAAGANTSKTMFFYRFYEVVA
jgi:hypothetical protein